jgi:phage shock protein A
MMTDREQRDRVIEGMLDAVMQDAEDMSRKLDTLEELQVQAELAVQAGDNAQAWEIVQRLRNLKQQDGQDEKNTHRTGPRINGEPAGAVAKGN